MKLLVAAILSAAPLWGEDVRVLGSPPKGWTPITNLTRSSDVSGTPDGRLVVKCGLDWIAYTCSAIPCKIRVCQPQGQNITSKTLSPWEWNNSSSESMSRSWLQREPTRGVTAGARGAFNLNDAAVRQTGGQIAFAPVLRRVVEGRYCFQLDSLPKGGMPSRMFTLDWTRDDVGAISLPGLAPGLYALDAGKPAAAGSCEIKDPGASPAWVMVTPDGQYERVIREWESYSQKLRTLQAETDADVAAIVRHALLAALADSVR
jgi:hypothetical protein